MELNKTGPIEVENTLLPWATMLSVCSDHSKPVVGFQAGFMEVMGAFGTGFVTTYKALCTVCLRELAKKPGPDVIP